MWAQSDSCYPRSWLSCGRGRLPTVRIIDRSDSPLAGHQAAPVRLGRFLQRKSFLLLLLPALALYLVLVVYPFLNSLRISLFEWKGIGAMKYVGLDNFRRLLFVSPYRDYFLGALKHNFVFFGLSFVMKVCGGLAIALVLAQDVRGAGFYRTVYFIPITLSMTAVGYLWGLLLNPQWGVVNNVLESIGLSRFALPWLGDAELALPTVAAVYTWRSVGFVIVVLHAAIVGVPRELRDAARVDGASRLQYTLRIMMPLLMPTIVTITVLEFIWSMDVFDVIYALTGLQGGPYRSTDVLGLLFYRTAFGGFSGSATELGMGSATAVLMFLIILPISLFLTALRRRTEVTL